jgi:hypothetical protein
MILKMFVKELSLKKQLNREIVRSRIFVEQTEAPERGILCSRTRWLIARPSICAVSDPVHIVITPIYYSYSRRDCFIHNGFPQQNLSMFFFYHLLFPFLSSRFKILSTTSPIYVSFFVVNCVMSYFFYHIYAILSRIFAVHTYFGP